MDIKQNKTTQSEHHSQDKSLEEVHGTVETQNPKLWKRIFAFAGPAYLVSVGYMDPGNWATDIEGGARFGYMLIWVLLMSNIMAVVLQTLCARLGIVTGKDLAQACRAEYAKPVSFVLWILCEIAIAACERGLGKLEPDRDRLAEPGDRAGGGTDHAALGCLAHWSISR